MDINQIWAAVEPYVLQIVEALGLGTILGIVIKSLFKRFEKKHQASDIAAQTAQCLANKMVKVDVTAITDKKLDKLNKQLTEELHDIHTETAAYKHMLALIGGAMTKLKAVTQDERAALIKAVQALESDYTPPEPDEVISVKLDPIAPQEDAQPAEPQPEAASDRF